MRPPPSPADVGRAHGRVLVIGLDSVSPWLLFERFRPVMPNVRRLLERSRYGTLRSTDPPITVPAWAVMFSGMDPGSLGLYGFRHRKPGRYWEMYTPSSRSPLEPMVWDRLSRAGRRVCVIGMPPGYPPPILNGVAVSDFLTPASAKDIASPPSAIDAIQRSAGGYEFDVSFRSDDRARIADDLVRMTRKRFAVARDLWQREPWDLLALHEIGPDRLHHTFWKFFDPTHPRYEENHELQDRVSEYYAILDREIGALLDLVPASVRILLVSDHGSQPMAGAFCINEWLIRRGYLTLNGSLPRAGTPLEETEVDWARTRAWGAGGYYARIFYNVRGREPHGSLGPDSVPDFEATLRRELSEIPAPDGGSLRVESFTPRERYHEVRGDAPDLMVYFGGCSWRSAGTVGHGRLYLEENDTGPDDAVHSFDGIYSVSDPAEGAGRPGPPERIVDIGPTLLDLLGEPVPPGLHGRVIDGFR